MPGHESYKLTPEQLDAVAQGGGARRRPVGGGRDARRGDDPKQVMESLKHEHREVQGGPLRRRRRRQIALAPTCQPRRACMDRIIDAIEWLARAIFVGIVAPNIFIAVVLRKFFSTSIPDSYDFGTHAARHR